jgi:hypothetical protein
MPFAIYDHDKSKTSFGKTSFIQRSIQPSSDIVPTSRHTLLGTFQMSSDSEPPENRFLFLGLEASPDEPASSPNQLQPKQKARVKSLAHEHEIKLKSFADTPKTERILERIRKCFARGQHPTTPRRKPDPLSPCKLSFQKPLSICLKSRPFMRHSPRLGNDT